jgi:hypothetical protein
LTADFLATTTLFAPIACAAKFDACARDWIATGFLDCPFNYSSGGMHGCAEAEGNGSNQQADCESVPAYPEETNTGGSESAENRRQDWNSCGAKIFR